MEYKKCPLYGLQSKKTLRYLLNIKDTRMLKQDYVSSLVEPYIDLSGKPRLIEPPSAELKVIQRRIKNYLGKIEVPENVFSGIKKRSYAGNAAFHTGKGLRNLYKVDLTAFFPSITRDTVYCFFRLDMKCSPDVANILTNLTTIDLSKASLHEPEAIKGFLAQKRVKTLNHLISGAPTSQMLSYLVNHNMFDELQSLADKNGITMTVYVDDVTFSSEQRISHNFREKIKQIIRKYNYRISKGKVKNYTKLYPKLVTGAIIDADGQLTVKNSLRYKIILEHRNLRNNPDNIKSRQRLRGLVTAARQVNKQAYPNIRRFAFETQE